MPGRGYPSSKRRVTDLRPPVEAADRTQNRTCDSCGGAMPKRTHRQRNSQGQLVCDSCKDTNMPSWSTTHSALSVLDQSEMARREAEAITSIVRVRKAKHSGLAVVAHDSGDNAIISHCPFCGSGAVIGGSDGTTSCDFCHSNFTVQVQPAHPFMPQTVDGQPNLPPGMPGGEETDLSAPVDPTANEDEDGVNEDALGDADPAKSNGPVAPGQPKSKQPPPPSKADPENTSNKPPWLKEKKSSRTAADFNYNPPSIRNPVPVEGCPHNEWTAIKSIGPGRYELYRCEQCGGRFRIYDTMTEEWGEPAWHPGAAKPPQGVTGSFRTSTGATLDKKAYMAHLALEMADDREVVLDSVRMAHRQQES